ncbi:hypothetical protein GUITHDRAFT_99889 [Guillardia theta CCMP2712]|uniref:Phosphate transporter n=1 Tax=Guillardia theta (strain CCMP2712) TaxID=905079 RepID=L1K1H2_GUITC|nr:hypothetical protein GUITHDRAFT_99889 [Guillardia theta CCMP2712]EKX54409.1 hypothetical protein GUITHDRAFT_99889 [Guillardia theta CCMP2712]|eukprot:XP_005841389.1 hypothetical protein GUITHDRAFT_99889 [Guillardia theta CCMP2712]
MQSEVGVPWLHPAWAIFSFFWAFIDAYGIGANDVANSFSTAVASRTITHKQAVAIALFAEAFGAIVLGSSVTDTVRKKIVDVSRFYGEPYVLMMGMGCSSLVGVGMAAFGLPGVIWDYQQGGVASIVASWFISPFCAGVVASTFYSTLKYLVLKHEGELSFQKGPALSLDKLPLPASITIIIAIAAAGFVFSIRYLVPWCRRVIEKNEDIPWYRMFDMPPENEDAEMEVGQNGSMIVHESGEQAAVNGSKDTESEMKEQVSDEGVEAEQGGDKSRRWALTIADKFVVDVSEQEVDETIDQSVEKHDSNTEKLYKVLQVGTCSFASLAHGANDIANSIGPLATVWMVYSTGRATSKAPVPVWILVYGAVALDIGLLTYGHHIMRALGNKLTYHSPSRGLSMDLGAMFTVLTFSKLGAPISTTHCKCGATAAVGLCSGDWRSVNWRMVAIILFGWILTLPCAGLMSGLLFYLVATGPRPEAGSGFFGSQ